MERREREIWEEGVDVERGEAGEWSDEERSTGGGREEEAGREDYGTTREQGEGREV